MTYVGRPELSGEEAGRLDRWDLQKIVPTACDSAKLYIMVYWVDVVLGACAMSELPPATRKPPVSWKPVQSMAP